MFSRHKHETPKPSPMPEATETISQSESLSENHTGSLRTDENAPKKRGRKPGSASQARQTDTIKKIRTTLEMAFGTAAGLMGMAPGAIARDGVAIRVHSPNIIDALCTLCEQDKQVREFFLSLSTGSAYANVAIASLPLIIAIMANHNLIPPIFGTPAPITAESNGVSVNPTQEN